MERFRNQPRHIRKTVVYRTRPSYVLGARQVSGVPKTRSRKGVGRVVLHGIKEAADHHRGR